MQTGLLKLITQPVAGLTRLTLIAASTPKSVAIAYLTSSTSGQPPCLPVRDDNGESQVPIANILSLFSGSSRQELSRKLAKALNYARFLRDTPNLNLVSAVERLSSLKISNTTLNRNQVIIAGNFKGTSDRLTVKRRRSNLENKKQQVPVLAQSATEQSHPIVTENDIIVVSRGKTRIVEELSLLFNPAALVLGCFKY